MTLTKSPLLTAPVLASLLVLTGCQTVQKTTAPSVTTPIIAPNLPNVDLPQRFTINGKIGVKSPKQSGSAFYTWSQAGGDFAISLEGILGVGRTDINYDGNLTTIKSEKIPTDSHTLTARSPEELLQQVSGWNAPISQLPYWILGKYAPSDSQNQLDPQGRLSLANNSDWTAKFSYDGMNKNLPSKIIMENTNGTKVTLTINHL